MSDADQRSYTENTPCGYFAVSHAHPWGLKSVKRMDEELQGIVLLLSKTIASVWLFSPFIKGAHFQATKLNHLPFPRYILYNYTSKLITTVLRSIHCTAFAQGKTGYVKILHEIWIAGGGLAFPPSSYIKPYALSIGHLCKIRGAANFTFFDLS